MRTNRHKDLILVVELKILKVYAFLTPISLPLSPSPLDRFGCLLQHSRGVLSD